MSFEVPPMSSADPVPAAQSASRTGKPQPAGMDDPHEVRLDTVPSSPPDDVLAETERAARRVDELKAEGRELHFAFNETTRRVQIEVRDLDGNVLRTIPPSKALAVASGEKLD